MKLKRWIAAYLLIAKITIRAMSRRIIGIMMPTRNVVLSGSVVISADQLDSLNISLVVYALILNLNNFMKYHYRTLHYKTSFIFRSMWFHLKFIHFVPVSCSRFQRTVAVTLNKLAFLSTNGEMCTGRIIKWKEQVRSLIWWPRSELLYCLPFWQCKFYNCILK